MVLQPVIDDSGKGEKPVFVLAGFVLSLYMWTVFADQWKTILDAHPQIEYFKMKEAANFNGQFANFSTNQRDMKVEKLVSLIMDHKPLALRHVTQQEAYERTFKEKFAKKVDYPYFLSYYGLIGTLLKYQIENEWHRNDISDFIFDEQGSESDWVQKAWSFAVKALPEGFGSLIGEKPRHRNDRTFLPLQAADLFAWHVRRCYAEQSRGKEFSDPNWKRLCSLKCAKDEWDKERLEKLAHRLRASGLVFEYDLKNPKQRKIYRNILRNKADDAS